VFSPQLVLSVGFEAMSSPAGKFNGIHRSGMNSKIGFRSIHVVSEAAAVFLHSTQQGALSFFGKTKIGVKNCGHLTI